MSGSVCRVPDTLPLDEGEQKCVIALPCETQYLREYQLHSFKTKKPRRGGVSFGPAATAIALAKVSGNLCFSGRDTRPGKHNSGDKSVSCLASSLPRHLFPTLGIKMLWARERNSYRSRGSLHGSRYSRSGATRKGEKAMAGQRKNPTTGAVTVSKPTDRQTPKRAGGAVVTNPRKSGTPVGSGSRVAAPGLFPRCVESCETLFLKPIVGASTLVGASRAACPSIILPLWRL